MKKIYPRSLAAACVLLTSAFAWQTQANIINGGFESGFTGWTRADQLGSEGTFALQTGTTSPVTGETVPAPPEGNTAAMTDAQGPGSHVLYQSFTIMDAVPSATLGFDLFIGNRADDFRSPDTLDFSTPTLNQQARVDILRSGADPFSVDPGDVLLSLYRTDPGDALVSGYTHMEFDVAGLLNANLNQELVLRFAETDNVFTFQFGVDNVALTTGTAPVPDSAPGALGFLALAGICWAGERRLRIARAA